ncbi:putative RNA polymerase II transcription mediator complex subunit Srb7 [Aspergillus violaceofuscus CBS 115571]|uniref:Mediator of RNA polymerase II transcription subunit 21 n=1 Tax=Aspergillus violaceofuscus (strain CBS 115571) TaxID=1450538 RepID=A0A2V5GZW8_ASPV1|nr:putative RNA polymerase II transcription mediator complex subunit Srb7 [Aspergillus violaceofuscus CBS 115571]
MADILTQLQTCLDQLATQFYATLGYLTTYHDNSAATVPPQTPHAAPALAKIPKTSSAPPVPASAPLAAQQQSNQTQQTPAENPAPVQPGAPEDTPTQDPTLPPAPDSPRTFAARQRELARDLVIKEQQIEYLISVLPGIGSSEAEQERRIKELEGELRRWEGVRGERMQELKALRGRLEGVLGAMEVGVYGERA